MVNSRLKNVPLIDGRVVNNLEVEGQEDGRKVMVRTLRDQAIDGPSA